MTSKTKCYLFVAFFSFFVVLYIFLTKSPLGFDLIKSLDIFSHDHDNFIFVMITIVALAYVLTELVASAQQVIKKVGLRNRKIGKILVSQGFITQNQLQEALREQKLKMGEILVHGKRITPQQRDRALKYQLVKYRKIGKILRGLGYSTEEDIHWAIKQMNRKLGRILREKRLISDYDLTCALSLKKCRIDDHGRVVL